MCVNFNFKISITPHFHCFPQQKKYQQHKVLGEVQWVFNAGQVALNEGLVYGGTETHTNTHM